jgi:GNAT superfamily N-acetyltransferase
MTMSEFLDTPRPTPKINVEELVVSESVDPAHLRLMLKSLIQEDCVHSWRNFGLDGTAAELLQWENARRPTKIFYFSLKRGSETHFVGAGAVADRLTKDFPHDGFPVIGRCCILPEFRSNGYYRRVLQYRLEYCRREYGSGLKAIHIGAVNTRISRVITNHGLADWPLFIHMGEEALNVAGEIRNVGAYLLLMPEYTRRIRRSLAGEHAPQCVLELRDELSKVESGDLRDLGLTVKRKYDQARATGWLDGRDTGDIEQMLLFCSSVPLVNFD